MAGKKEKRATKKGFNCVAAGGPNKQGRSRRKLAQLGRNVSWDPQKTRSASRSRNPDSNRNLGTWPRRCNHFAKKRPACQLDKGSSQDLGKKPKKAEPKDCHAKFKKMTGEPNKEPTHGKDTRSALDPPPRNVLGGATTRERKRVVLRGKTTITPRTVLKLLHSPRSSKEFHDSEKTGRIGSAQSKEHDGANKTANSQPGVRFPPLTRVPKCRPRNNRGAHVGGGKNYRTGAVANWHEGFKKRPDWKKKNPEKKRKLPKV